MVRISDIIRAEFAEGDNKRDAGLKTPENIVRYDDIIYGTESKWQKLDVYRPKDAMLKLPVIVSVHGYTVTKKGISSTAWILQSEALP